MLSAPIEPGDRAARRRCAVLGDPVAHSLSPVLHRAAYAACGLRWDYDAVRVPAGGLAGFLAGLDPMWRGLSVTMPLKHEALAAASRVTPRAQLVGAANTLVLEGEDVVADNTDLPGAVEALRERWPGTVTTGTVLGAGATAASTGLALCELGARTVTVLARSAERAARAADAIARHPSGPHVVVGSLAHDRPSGEVVVSTIPAGAQDADLVVRCAQVPVVFEVVYDPWPTPLAAAVDGSGERVLVTGLDLLVHQAGLQLQAFTGLAPEQVPLVAMREAGRAALVARGAGSSGVSG